MFDAASEKEISLIKWELVEPVDWMDVIPATIKFKCRKVVSEKKSLIRAIGRRIAEKRILVGKLGARNYIKYSIVFDGRSQEEYRILSQGYLVYKGSVYKRKALLLHKINNLFDARASEECACPEY